MRLNVGWKHDLARVAVVLRVRRGCCFALAFIRGNREETNLLAARVECGPDNFTLVVNALRDEQIQGGVPLNQAIEIEHRSVVVEKRSRAVWFGSPVRDTHDLALFVDVVSGASIVIPDKW